MEIFGIKFAPLNTPLHRRIQILAVAASLWIPSALLNLANFLLLFLIFTPLWFIPLSYFIWIFIIDRKTPEQGGRRIESIANSELIRYTKHYYPITLKVDPELALDVNRNYLFCSFPHGVIAKGITSTIITNAHGFHKMFPHHQRNFVTLPVNFKIPIYRDYLLARGGCSSSAKSIDYLLGYPGGGRITVLVVGGAAEALYARPGPYRLVLKNRKGFIKLALKNGAPLVPVFSFGENDLFNQLSNPEGSLLRRFQEYVKAKMGISPIIIYGRGFLQYSFGLLPQRKPINVVVGKAIEVGRIENPTAEDIDTLHKKFTEELIQLFEKHKHQYVEKPENQSLIIL